MKIRPTVLLLAAGMVAALIIICLGIVAAATGNIAVELLAALIAFGGTIVAGIIGVSTKLIESEEVTTNGKE